MSKDKDQPVIGHYGFHELPKKDFATIYFPVSAAKDGDKMATMIQPPPGPAPKFVIHTQCCNADWDLVYLKDDTYRLQCGRCGRPSAVQVMGPKIADGRQQ